MMDQHKHESPKDTQEQHNDGFNPLPERDDPWVKAYMESVKTRLRPGPAESAVRRLVRRQWPLLAAGVLLISALVATVYAYVQNIERPEQNREDAVALEAEVEDLAPEQVDVPQPAPKTEATPEKVAVPQPAQKAQATPEKKMAVKVVVEPPPALQAEMAPMQTAPREQIQKTPARTRPPVTNAPSEGRVAVRKTPVGGASAALQQTAPRSGPRRTLTPEQKRLMAQEPQAGAIPRTQPRLQEPVRSMPPPRSRPGVTPPRYGPY